MSLKLLLLAFFWFGRGQLPCGGLTCTPPSDNCKQVSCVENVCSTSNAPASTPCSAEGFECNAATSTTTAATAATAPTAVVQSSPEAPLLTPPEKFTDNLQVCDGLGNCKCSADGVVQTSSSLPTPSPTSSPTPTSTILSQSLPAGTPSPTPSPTSSPTLSPTSVKQTQPPAVTPSPSATPPTYPPTPPPTPTPSPPPTPTPLVPFTSPPTIASTTPKSTSSSQTLMQSSTSAPSTRSSSSPTPESGRTFTQNGTASTPSSLPSSSSSSSLSSSPLSLSSSSSSLSSSQSSFGSNSSDGIMQSPPDSLSVGAIVGIAVGSSAALCLLIALVTCGIRRGGKTTNNADRDVELPAAISAPSSPAHSEYARVQVSPTTGDYTRPQGNYAGAPPQLYDAAPPNLADYDSPPPPVQSSGEYGAVTHSTTRGSGYRIAGTEGHYDSVHDKL
jgi:hypothetical protein